MVFDGSNADDDDDYRPGSRAIAELGVISPLKEAGLTKAEIREISKDFANIADVYCLEDLNSEKVKILCEAFGSYQCLIET